MAFGQIDTPSVTDFGAIRSVAGTHQGCWQNDEVNGTARIVVPPPSPPPIAGGRQPAGPTPIPPLAKIIIEGLFIRTCDCKPTPNNTDPWEHTTVGTVTHCNSPGDNFTASREFTYTDSEYKGICDPSEFALVNEYCSGGEQKPFNFEITSEYLSGGIPFGPGMPGSFGPGVNPPQWAKDCGLKDLALEWESTDMHAWAWKSPEAVSCALEHIKCSDSGVTKWPATGSFPYPETPGDVLAGMIMDYLSSAAEFSVRMKQCKGISEGLSVDDFDLPSNR